MTKLIFMGTPEFAVPALKALLEAHEVLAVFSQPPRPAGRGQALRKSPVQLLAEANNVPVYTPEKLTPEVLEHCKGAEVAVVAAYGLLLPEWFLKAFPKGCINIHPSALPRWRGAAPIQRTVLAGDAHTEICIMQMEKGLDTGPILLKEKLPLPSDITSGELHDLLAERAAPLLLQAVAQLGKLQAVPQSTEGVTYAKKIEKAEAQIDWRQSAVELERKVRGLNPFPGAFFVFQGQRIKVLKATLAEAQGQPGTMLNDTGLVACGVGALQLELLQREGKGPLAISEFLRGFPLPKGTDLCAGN